MNANSFREILDYQKESDNIEQINVEESINNESLIE